MIRIDVKLCILTNVLLGKFAPLADHLEDVDADGEPAHSEVEEDHDEHEEEEHHEDEGKWS